MSEFSHIRKMTISNSINNQPIRNAGTSNNMAYIHVHYNSFIRQVQNYIERFRLENNIEQ